MQSRSAQKLTYPTSALVRNAPNHKRNRQTKLTTLLNLRALHEVVDDSLWAILEQFATRRSVAAQSSLFSAGELARFYFLVESGEVLISRQATHRQGHAVRVLSAGDIFSYGCGDQQAADCTAMADSVLRCVERRVLDDAALTSGPLRRLIFAVHTAELELVLESLPASRADVEDNASSSNASKVLRPDFRRQRRSAPSS